MKAEIIDDVRYAKPRFALDRRLILGVLAQLRRPCELGEGGPGGWRTLREPGIELPEAREFSPDVAGWRRGQLPDLPDDAPLVVLPDWVCETGSRRTRAYDLHVKRAFCARTGVGQSVSGGTTTRCAPIPFEAVEIDLAAQWPEPLEE